MRSFFWILNCGSFWTTWRRKTECRKSTYAFYSSQKFKRLHLQKKSSFDYVFWCLNSLCNRFSGTRGSDKFFSIHTDFKTSPTSSSSYQRQPGNNNHATTWRHLSTTTDAIKEAAKPEIWTNSTLSLFPWSSPLRILFFPSTCERPLITHLRQ